MSCSFYFDGIISLSTVKNICERKKQKKIKENVTPNSCLPKLLTLISLEGNYFSHYYLSGIFPLRNNLILTEFDPGKSYPPMTFM